MPTEEEFNRDWVTPDEAAAAFGPHSSRDITHRVRVLNRLRGGQLIAVARSASLGSKPPIAFAIIKQQSWDGWDGEYDETFWEHGDAVFNVAISSHTGYDLTSLRCFDIRFDPTSFSGRPPPTPPDPDVGEPDPVQRRRDLPPLSDKLLHKWHALFVEAYPTGTVTFARESVDGMFPNRFVSRTRLRELFPDVKAGRPRENNRLDNSPKNDGE